jgi:cell division protein FtsL
MRSHVGVIRLAFAFTALLASMSLVVWRQSRALEVLRALDEARTTRAIGEAERSELNRRIEFLESRSRVVEEAEERLGMHVPSSDEMIFLPLNDRPAPSSSAVATARPRAAGASQP